MPAGQDHPMTHADEAATPLRRSTAFGSAILHFQLFHWSLLRTPGLPVDVLRPLTDDDALTSAGAVLAGDSRLAELKAEFARDHLPAAQQAAFDAGHRPDLTRLARARRCIARGDALAGAQLDSWLAHGDPTFADRWQQAVAEQAVAIRHAERAHRDAIMNGYRYLLQRCAQPDVAHAIFLSSRDFFDNSFTHHVLRADGVRSGSRARQTYATAARYLRRLSVRCELTSFFGPVHWVRFDHQEPAGLRLAEPGQETILVEPSVWLIDELNQLAQRRLPLAERRPRRHPLVRDAGNHLLRITDGQSFHPAADAMALWRTLDGSRTVAEAATAIGIDLAQARALLSQLSGILVPIAEIPAHELAAFDEVLARSPMDGSAHEVDRLRRKFAATPWPQRREIFDQAEQAIAELGSTVRRGKGQHYVDRYVFHEERTHPLSARTVLGRPAVTGLASALADVLPLSFLAALLQREDARAAVRAAIGGRRTPLLDLLRTDVPVTWTRTTALHHALAALVRARTKDGSAQLHRDDLTDLIERFCPPLPEDDCYATLAGPDMMVLGDPATAPWLLSELHDDGSYLAGGVSRSHPEGASVRDELLGAVVKVIDPTRMAAVVSRRRNMFLVPEMPGTAIELSGMSRKPRGETVPISDVTVDPDGAALRVGDRRLHLYTGDIPSVQHRALAVPSLTPVPIDFDEWTPRVLISSTVIQRARWRLALPELPAGYAGWQELHRIRQERGLPRRVFARHPGERKPLFVDFADPHAVADLLRLPPSPITFSEMLPDFEQLWWYLDDRAQCAELRTACLVYLEIPRIRPTA